MAKEKAIKKEHIEFSLLPKEKILTFTQPSHLSFFWFYFIGFVLIFTVFLSIIGIIIIVITYFYRGGHKYWVTNKRIVIARTFITRSIREITYDQITDVSLNQGILGRIFNFGTLIPLTASGVGASMIHTGYKSTTIASTLSEYSLFGVPNPLEIRNLIMQCKINKK